MLNPDARIPGVEYNDNSVVAGNPLDLLDSLIFPLCQDYSFAEAFLATYRFFIAPQRLLDTLIEWYNVDLYEDCSQSEELFLKRNRKLIKTRAAKILWLWIKNYWQDFANCSEIFIELLQFVDGLAETSFGDNQKLTEAIREQVNILNNQSV